MPPGPRPPRQEDEAYNAYGSKRMQGKFAGVRNGRQQSARPNLKNAAMRRLAEARKGNKRKTYPGDETKPAKGDHIGTTERAQGSLLDQGIYARANRDRAREAASQRTPSGPRSRAI